MPLVKATGCYQQVCVFRYADDMLRVGACESGRSPPDSHNDWTEGREQVSQWDGRHSSSGVTTSLASNRSLAESPTTCGACASTGTSRSVVSAPGATLISRGRPSSSNTSTVKV